MPTLKAGELRWMEAVGSRDYIFVLLGHDPSLADPAKNVIAKISKTCQGFKWRRPVTPLVQEGFGASKYVEYLLVGEGADAEPSNV